MSATSRARPAPLFTFAIITDTHIRPPGGDESSPFPVNELANARARYAVQAIARHAPAFTIHLGDMVHPLPHLPSYDAAAREALEILSPLGDSLRFVPGNHDIGDKPMAGAPAGAADEESTRIYARHFGPPWYSFDHDGVHFVVMNASLVGSRSALEDEQRAWLEEDLARNSGGRILLFSHYPPFIDTADEPTHYDNYEPAGRAWLLRCAEKSGVEAIFSGHVHQFFYNRHAGTAFYCLPPTSFTRQDYSELYQIGPASEFGRNDLCKFSYALVDIYPEGHRLRVIPTRGRGLDPGEAITEDDPVAARPAPAPFTVHVRHAWARAFHMPYNGPMEEFGRKRARDDYLLLRLWQMGISCIRTPLADLLDPGYRRRIDDFHAAGIRFTFFCAGMPDAGAWRACLEAREMIDAVECVTSTTDLSDLGDALSRFDADGGPPLRLGKFHSSAHEPKQGTRFAHSVSYGFLWAEREDVRRALARHDRRGVIRSLAFQLNLADAVKQRLAEMDDWAQEQDLEVAAVIRLADPNPAQPNFDDAAILERVREAVEAAGSLARTSLQLDTFADIDRGYHPRHGLIDRRSNMRRAGVYLAGREEP